MVLLAKRVRSCVPPATSSSVSSASLYLQMAAKISWQRSLLSIGNPYRNIAEAGGRGPVACAHGLRGLALAAVGSSPQHPVAGIADGIAGVPELRCDAAVARVLEHPNLF